MGVTRYSN